MCSSCGDSVIAWFDVADIRLVVNSASSDSNAMSFSRSICHSFSWNCSWIKERSQTCLTTDEHCCSFSISHNWFMMLIVDLGLISLLLGMRIRMPRSVK